MSRSRHPAQRSRWQRARGFLHDYTEGVSAGEIRRLVDRDASRAYSVLMRDQPDPVAGRKGLRRLLVQAKLLFLSVSQKLSPGRRMLFAGSLIAAALGLAEIRLVIDGDGGKVITLDSSALFFLAAIAGLLFLFAVELVDRVLVRDELSVARELQRELLPQASPDLPGWRFAHSWRTANEIGGDYYHFEPLPDGRLALIVADASGHGMAAGLIMAVANASLLSALEQDPSPAVVAQTLHRAVRRMGNRRAFMTLFYGLLEPATGGLEYVCAGHPFPLLRRTGGAIEEAGAGSFPVGLRDRLTPVLGSLTLEPGDLLVLFSDGLFEAVDHAGQAFGFERLRAELASATGASEAHARIQAAFARHVGEEPLADDLTLVVVERSPRQAP